MDMSMPMMPGLENSVPVVHPFLPAAELPMEAASRLPEAIPSELVELADGDTLELTASLVRRTIDGREFVMYGYNGMHPGPLIRVNRGSTIVVNFRNDITLPTTVHWHGIRIDNRFDGTTLTQAPVRTGEAFTYEVNFPDAGVYWYHPHQREDIQQDLGLYGNMLVGNSQNASYYNPVNREEALILDDLLIDDAGILPYGKQDAVHALMGRFGNVMLTNGSTGYELNVDRGDVVRFFVTNVANARTFNLTFDGQPIKLVGSDVSKFQKEAWVESVPIAPAERYIVDVLFDEPGEFALTNSIQAINHFRGEFYPHVDTLGIVHVADDPTENDHGEAFNSLRTHDDVADDIASYREHFDRPVDHSLELSVRVKNLPLPIVTAMEVDTLYVPPIEWNDAMPMMNWLSSAEQVTWILRDVETGKENMDVHWRFQQGDVAKIRIFNDPRSFHPMQHPIHIHGQRFLVLNVDGVPNPNLVWKDTAIVPVGSTVDFLVDMSNPGDWMLHCHIAEHLESDMMLQFTVEP